MLTLRNKKILINQSMTGCDESPMLEIIHVPMRSINNSKNHM